MAKRALRAVPSAPPSWEATMRTALAKAGRILPPGVAGELGAQSVLDDARAMLARIQKALGGFSDPRATPTGLLPSPGSPLRKAAGVLAQGAQDAAGFARQVKDDIAGDLQSFAWSAWKTAAGPLLIVGLGYLLWQSSQSGGGKKDETETLTMLGLAWLAARALL